MRMICVDKDIIATHRIEAKCRDLPPTYIFYDAIYGRRQVYFVDHEDGTRTMEYADNPCRCRCT